ncbi:VOC family protein [Lichenicoccus sp.]|uniref:VOC family protein n=1 Tax=Lichenicoccus sp. TaxID=2781899 RepID=UPI003D0E6B20
MVFAALVTPDLVAAERFYTDLFGWQFQNAYVRRHLFGEASINGRVVAAIVQKPIRHGERPAWRSFLSTEDVEKSAQVAVQHGASMLLGPHEIANLGRDALLTDPQGAVFGMLTSSSGDPADTLAAPGAWIWSSLITHDPETDAAFYKAVFGYDVFDLPDPQEAKHVILASQTYARASVNPIPTKHPALHPRWISYVRVLDIAAMVGHATTLGAHVVVPPHQDRNGGTIALVADPAGAIFGLLALPDDAGPGDTAAGDAK